MLGKLHLPPIFVSMGLAMFPAMVQLEIVGGVVQAVPIFVVNYLNSRQEPALNILHHQPVLEDHPILVAAGMTWRVLKDVTQVVHSSTPTLIRWSDVGLRRTSGSVHVS